MSNIGRKTIAFLIDELITTSNRCWHAQDRIMDESLSTKQRLDAAIIAQEMNARRSKLIAAIEERMGEGKFSQPSKTYTYFSETTDE